jgi:hypothetical protein
MSASRWMMPFLENFCLYYEKPDFDYISLIVTYGSKNFLSEESAPSAEVLAFAAPVNLVQKFFKKAITDDDLLNGSDIYLGDRDSSATVHKIKVTLG